MSRMKNTKPFKKNIRAEVNKIIYFKIKTIIYKKAETWTATILKNWQLQKLDEKQEKEKKEKEKEKNTPPHFI